MTTFDSTPAFSADLWPELGRLPGPHRPVLGQQRQGRTARWGRSRRISSETKTAASKRRLLVRRDLRVVDQSRASSGTSSTTRTGRCRSIREAAPCKGTASIDGGTYNLLLRPHDRNGWQPLRQQRHPVEPVLQYPDEGSDAAGRSPSAEHFDRLERPGRMTLGNVLEASILVETGSGNGSVSFTTANVTAQ